MSSIVVSPAITSFVVVVARAAVASAIAWAVNCFCFSSALCNWATVSAFWAAICDCICCICICICCICCAFCCAAASAAAAFAAFALAVLCATSCAEIYCTNSSPYCAQTSFERTHPDTIVDATPASTHPPLAHFGWAQRKITALQLPKSATGASVASEPDRTFINVFQLLLFVAPDAPLYAVKLLPRVVGTGAESAPNGTTAMANNKNLAIDFIFSLYG